MENKIKIKLLYFASIRHKTKIDQEEYETNSSTPIDVFTEITKKYNFEFPNDILKYAVNEEYVASDETLKNGDTLVFIPPVAGG